LFDTSFVHTFYPRTPDIPFRCLGLRLIEHCSTLFLSEGAINLSYLSPYALEKANNTLFYTSFIERGDIKLFISFTLGQLSSLSVALEKS
jgi:hypothetical protein